MRWCPVVVGSACLGGCIDVPRTERVCRVVDEADHRPVPGAHVHMQPYAPIHPFWPRASDGVTDAAGDVTLALPTGFWFYRSAAKADGYVPGTGPVLQGNEGVFGIFYMRRDRP